MSSNTNSTPSGGGPLRKQNVACDACRQKKVRCNRVKTTEKCAQCIAKNAECTSFYIDSLQHKVAKRPRKTDDGTGTGNGSGSAGPSYNGHSNKVGTTSAAKADVRRQSEARPSVPLSAMDRDEHDQRNSGSYGHESNGGVNGGYGAQEQRSGYNGGPYEMPPGSAVVSRRETLSDIHGTASRSSLTRLPSYTARTSSEKQFDLLRFLFAPDIVTGQEWGYNDLADIQICDEGQSDLWESLGGRVYKEAPSEAHLKYPDDGLLDLADDLIETFFSIAHIRFPILDQQTFRERFSQPDTHPLGPMSHAMLATAIALGARFSDNPVITTDRAEVSARETGPRSWSRMVHLLVIRAREVAEVNKCHRIATVENCQSLTLIEVLLGQCTFLDTKYQAYHVHAATRHALVLGLGRPESLTWIQDEKRRQSAVYLWWHTSMSDAWRSAFCKLRTFLSDDDVDLDSSGFTTENETEQKVEQGLSGSGGGDSGSLGLGQGQGEAAESLTLLWVGAANAGCFICRKLCAGLWSPRVLQNGIATSTLRDFVHYNSLWRDKYIAKLGVPSKWPEQWDFLAAISSCSTDAYFHCLWMIVYRAIASLGLQNEKEAKGLNGDPQAQGQAGRSGQTHSPINHVELDSLKRRIQEEAEHGAIRIAALVNVLTENGYLRLDPLILSYPIYLAGLILAEGGKEESLTCVAGLKQYSISFGQQWELAEEIETVYNTTTARWRAERQGQGSQGPASLSQLLLAPVGHMGPMGPWGLDSTPVSAPVSAPSSISAAHDMAHLSHTHALPQQHPQSHSHSLHHLPGQGQPIHVRSGFSSVSNSNSPHLGATLSPENGGAGGLHHQHSQQQPMYRSPLSQAHSLHQTPDGLLTVRGSGSVVEQGKGKGKEDWHVTGAGAVLAANGFTALPMLPSSGQGLPAAPTRDTATALFDWLQRP